MSTYLDVSRCETYVSRRDTKSEAPREKKKKKGREEGSVFFTRACPPCSKRSSSDSPRICGFRCRISSGRYWRTPSKSLTRQATGWKKGSARRPRSSRSNASGCAEKFVLTRWADVLRVPARCGSRSPRTAQSATSSLAVGDEGEPRSRRSERGRRRPHFRLRGVLAETTDEKKKGDRIMNEKKKD